jgi:hypothetical protein
MDVKHPKNEKYYCGENEEAKPVP